MDKTLLCLGFGYSAAALAALLLPEGWTVLGTQRQPRAAPPGVALHLWPETGAEEALAPLLAQSSHWLLSAPPGPAGDPLLAAIPDLAARFAPRWIGYLSTTAVYGDRGGATVDEDSAPAPQSPRAIARLAAENAWRATGLPVEVFRLSGIYGPGRSAFDKLRAGTARRIVKPGQIFSRIHVADIAAALQAALHRPAPGAVYNLADDLPAPPQDVIAYAAALLGLPAPPDEPWDSATLSPMAASFYAENKRVRAEKTKAALGLAWRYPSYREGLAAILAAEEKSPPAP